MSDRDPRDDGCLCQKCDNRYKVDFNLPDELWEKTHGSYNLLCGTCIVLLIEGLGEFDYFHLVKLDETNTRDEDLAKRLLWADGHGFNRGATAFCATATDTLRRLTLPRFRNRDYSAGFAAGIRHCIEQVDSLSPAAALRTNVEGEK